MPGRAAIRATSSRRYGEPAGIAEFCLKAQLLNLETMKAMYEGWLDHSDTDASGVLIWMSQSAYPSLVWQTYDYYYDTTGAYWGAQDRLRAGPHLLEPGRRPHPGRQHDRQERTPAWSPRRGSTTWTGPGSSTGPPPVVSRPDTVADCFTLAYPAGLSATHFLKLRLKDPAGKIVSENFYWRGTNRLDYTALNDLKPVKLSVSSRLTKSGGSGLMDVAITNPASSRTVAFAIRPKLVNGATGEQILPVFMNDGYFSLVPGETKHVTIRFDPADAGPKAPKLVMECWNNAAKSPAAPASADKGNLAFAKPVTASSNNDMVGDAGDVVNGNTRRAGPRPGTPTRSGFAWTWGGARRSAG